MKDPNDIDIDIDNCDANIFDDDSDPDIDEDQGEFYAECYWCGRYFNCCGTLGGFATCHKCYIRSPAFLTNKAYANEELIDVPCLNCNNFIIPSIARCYYDTDWLKRWMPCADH